MLKVTVNRVRYECLASWHELTLKKASELMPLLLQFPDSMLEIYKLSLEGNKKKLAEVEVSDHDLIKTIPEVQGKVIERLTTIPAEVIEHISAEDRTAFYNEHLLPFVIGLLYFPYNYEPQGLKSFKYKGKRYLMPQYELDINGEPVPMAKAKAATFTEASDLMLAASQVTKGKFNYMAQVVATLCRRNKEPYDAEVIKQRAKEFDELPMSIVWEVFFYSIAFTATLRKTYPTYYQTAKAKVAAQ